MIPKGISHTSVQNPTNKFQKSTYMLWFFSLFYALPIDSPNHPALVGDAQRTEKKIREIKFFNCRSKFGLHRPLAKVHR
jgi:hypothetical protein